MIDDIFKNQIIATTPSHHKCRPPQNYIYSDNEVHMDVVENLSVLMKHDQVISTAVIGKVQIVTSLSGTPTLTLGINDTQAWQNRKKKKGQKGKVKNGIDLEDVTFHECVQMNQYEQDKTIKFIPPDGEFQLMSFSFPFCLMIIFCVNSLNYDLCLDIVCKKLLYHLL